MADTFNTTSLPPSEGAKLSPIGLAFSGFLGTTWPLIRAERDLAGLCGLGWDPAVDAWIRDAEAAHDATLAVLKDVITLPVMQDGDALLRIVARIWDRVMRSSDPAEVADLRQFIVDKKRLFRTERRDTVGNAINRLLDSSILRLDIYLNIIGRQDPDEDLLASPTGTKVPPHAPTCAIAVAELEPAS